MKKRLSFLVIIVGLVAISIFLVVLKNRENNSLNLNNQSDDRVKVASSIYPVYSLVNYVGGDKINNILIMPPGSSPHTYEVKPSQMKDLFDAKKFFVIGLNLDIWIDDIQKNSEDSEIVDLSNVVELITIGEDDGDEHEHSDFDPHYWLSPKNAESMVIEIARVLSDLDQENSEYYNSRVENFSLELKERNNIWEEKINSLENKNIVVFHGAWNYFVNYFGLNVVENFEEFPGKSPGPKHLIELQKLTKNYGIKVLFVEPQLSKEAVETFAKDLKVDLKVLDPLGGDEGRKSYFELMDYNLGEICNVK